MSYEVLEPRDIVALQHVNKRLLRLCRDDTLWREQCFNTSTFLESLRRKQNLLVAEAEQEPRLRDLARALAHGNGLGDTRLIKPREEARNLKAQANEKIRIMANWDPSYPEEKVKWYDEFIARNAPISTNWLQQPRNRESAEHEYMEVRGIGLYTPQGQDESTLIVGPLDDGSVCLWNISRMYERRGSIVARSKPGILSICDSPTDSTSIRSRMINTGVTECVSIDNRLRRAYFAVQNGMCIFVLPSISTVPRVRK